MVFVNHSLRVARSCLVVLVFCLIAPREATGAKLQPETLKAWETYVQLTEKRIAAELDSQRGFLVMDYMGGSEASRVRSLLKSGQVFIDKMKTTDASGREIRVEDGLIHHWFGSIFVPNVSLAVPRESLESTLISIREGIGAAARGQ